MGYRAGGWEGAEPRRGTVLVEREAALWFSGWQRCRWVRRVKQEEGRIRRENVRGNASEGKAAGGAQ